MHRQVHTPFDDQAALLVVGAVLECCKGRVTPTERARDKCPPILKSSGRVGRFGAKSIDATQQDWAPGTVLAIAEVSGKSHVRELV